MRELEGESGTGARIDELIAYGRALGYAAEEALATLFDTWRAVTVPASL